MVVLKPVWGFSASLDKEGRSQTLVLDFDASLVIASAVADGWDVLAPGLSTPAFAAPLTREFRGVGGGGG